MEKCLIGGLFHPAIPESEVQWSMSELGSLCKTAGGDVRHSFVQRKAHPDPRYFIGSGKVIEIRSSLATYGIETVILHNQLSPIQQKHLEEALACKIIDRTRLILDIFAARARSLEGKLQVELAQLLYLLPRLVGKGIELSRLGGGIGTRGPGETKLEVDRRTIHKRIALVRKRLRDVMKSRDVQRQGRQLRPVPVVSLVGYTSAGKSTLFHALTGEEVLVSGNLFSTLDPLLRRVDLGDIEKGYYFILSDTVGFIHHMPEVLFTAFRATLEEVVQADIILHIVDSANPRANVQRSAVEKVLTQLAVPAEKVITLFNKIDLQEDPEALSAKNSADEIYISAIKGLGIDAVREAIFRKYFSDYGRFHVEIPQADSSSSLVQWAIVVEKKIHNHIIEMELLSPKEKMRQFKKRLGGKAG